MNDFKNGNYSMMTSRQQDAVEDAINEFQDTYLKDEMSDFEKEIMIIKWLVENCSYQKGENWSNSTAYSCIVNGKAQCAGYADAFLQTAKACGLEARYVYNKTHAWNLLKLDGDWYHVDVTWEDPTGGNRYGFQTLRNAYINLEDSQIKTASSHHTWSPTTIKAKGIKYGPKVVAQYLKDGTIDTSKGESFEAEVEKFFNGVRNEDGSNIIIYQNDDQAAAEICAYLDKLIDGREKYFQFAVRFPSIYKTDRTGDYLKVSDTCNRITSKVGSHLHEKYEGILKNFPYLTLAPEGDALGHYYGYKNGNFYYKPGQGKMVSYVLRYIDMDTGSVVKTQSGSAELQVKIPLAIPEDYQLVGVTSKYVTVKAGSARMTRAGLYITDDTPAEVELRVQLKKQDSGKATSSNANF